MLEIDHITCQLNSARHFDTHANTAASQDLAAYVKYVHSGAILVGVTGDEPMASLAPAVETLRVAGIPVADVQYRGNFAFIIQKGYPGNVVVRKGITNTVSPAVFSVKLHGMMSV